MKDLSLKINLQAFDKVTGPFKAITRSSAKMRDGFEKATVEMSSLKMAKKDLAKYERLQSTTLKDAEALKLAQEKAQQLARQMAQTGTQSKRMAKSFEEARGRVAKLKTAQNEHLSQLSKVRERLKAAKLSTDNLGQSHRTLDMRIKKTNALLSEHAKKLNQAKAQAQKFKQINESYAKNMAHKANLSFAGFAGVETGKAFSRVAGSVINPGIAFEESMSKVGALARIDQTSESFAKLKKQAQDLGSTTSFSASEAAQGMGFLAMAGFKTNDILAAMPATLALAKAGGTDLAQTADIASNILSGFALEASEMSRVSDVLAATFTRSNVDLNMLGDSMKYVAPIVKELGGSLEDAAAMSGLLGNVGIQGSQAGTALRAMFTRMAAPPKMARDAIKQLGLVTKDAQGNMRPMVDIMADIAEKTKRMGNAERIEIFKNIAGEEAGTAFAELINKGGAGEITKFVEVLRKAQGEAMAISKAMGDNTAGDIKQFTSAYEGLAIAITQTNTNPMRELIQMGTDIVRTVTKWVEANPQLAATILKIVAAGAAFVTVLGGVALGIAGILGPLAMAKWSILTLGLKAKGIISIFPMIASGIRLIGAALIANPIGAAITAIGLAAYFIYDNWQPIKEWFVEFWQSLPDMIQTAIGYISNIMAPIGWIADKVSSFFSGDSEKKIAIEETRKITQGAKPVAGAASSPLKKAALASAVAAPLAVSPAASAIPTAQPVPSMQGHTIKTAPVERVGATNVHNEQITQNINITVTAAPGMDTNAIAKAVKAELEKIDRQNKRRAKTRLYD